MLVASNIVNPSGVSNTGYFPVIDLLRILGAPLLFSSPFLALPLDFASEAACNYYCYFDTSTSVYSIPSINAVTFTSPLSTSPSLEL